MTAARKPRPIVLDADGIRRLGRSIEHWARLATGNRSPDEDCGWKSCDLCARWLDLDCKGCPVKRATLRALCSGTPYWRAADQWSMYGLSSPQFRRAAIRELAFLVRLLARAKEKP